MQLLDRHHRPLSDLRVSVTDRCNLRCGYCMPEDEYPWLSRDDILRFEEIATLVAAFSQLGVHKVRLTGGEPLLRRDLPLLVRMIASQPAIQDIALTTNGLLLLDQLAALREAGLHRLTISLDTLQPARFESLTRRTGLDRVLAAIRAVAGAGFQHTKLDTVVIRGVNDDELIPLVEFARSVSAELRFIEYMDVGGATRWTPAQVVSRAELLHRLSAQYGPAEAISTPGDAAPAVRFRFRDGTVVGIVASTTEPFCATCNRARLTADGTFYLCLYAQTGLDLRGPLRSGISPTQLAALLQQTWQARSDRGAEARLALPHRGPLIPAGDLRRDSRLEMHTRGG